jgi:hypothetical protein
MTNNSFTNCKFKRPNNWKFVLFVSTGHSDASGIKQGQKQIVLHNDEQKSMHNISSAIKSC